MCYATSLSCVYIEKIWLLDIQAKEYVYTSLYYKYCTVSVLYIYKLKMNITEYMQDHPNEVAQV